MTLYWGSRLLQKSRQETKTVKEEEIPGKSGTEGASGKTSRCSSALPQKPAPFEIANPVTFATHGTQFQFSAYEPEQTLGPTFALRDCLPSPEKSVLKASRRHRLGGSVSTLSWTEPGCNSHCASTKQVPEQTGFAFPVALCPGSKNISHTEATSQIT